MTPRFPFFLFYLCLLHASGLPAGDLKVASPFSDHMVLQRDMPLPVWGWATPGESVTVEFSDQRKTTTADDSGKWRAILDSVPGNGTGSTFTIRSGESAISLRDVVVGEVWICSGQSNMQMGRKSVAELKDHSVDHLRAFEVKRTVAFTEQEELEGSWQVAGPESAVAFGFAHDLAKRMKGIPVGIISAAWGSSSIEAWMPRDMAEQLPYFKTILDEWDIDTDAHDRIRKALAAGKWSRDDDVFMRRQSNILYNAMIKPLVPFACRGLVWYQGERNTRYISGMPDSPWYHRVAGIREYDETLKAWIERYRKEWQRDDFHFLLVMLPGYGNLLPTGSTQDPDRPDSHSWAWMRESQLAALDLPHTSVVNTIDLGDVKNIHPRDKQPIGERLALLAARDTLAENIEASGPVFEKLEKKGRQLVVHFAHGEGLMTTDGKPPREFWIADKQGNWMPATAKIKGSTVILQSPELERPEHVRYAFTGKPAVNLVNESGLPAYPFRSDNFAP